MSIFKPMIAALIACLLFGAYMSDRGHKRERQYREVLQARLIPFDFMEAQYLRLVNEHGEFELEKRDGDEWWLTAPREMRADAAQVKTLVDNLHASKKTSEFESENLAEYGLDAPSSTVTVRGVIDGRKVEHTLLLGNDTAQIGRVYAKLQSDSHLFTVGDWIRNQMLADLGLLRDKSLLPIQADAVVGVTIGVAGDEFYIERRPGDLSWWLVDEQMPARQQFVNQMLATLASAKVASVIDDPTTSTALLGLDAPVLRIQLAEKQESHEMVIGARVPGKELFFAQTTARPGIATVRSSLISPLLVSKAEWGTRQFIWFPPENFVRIHTQTGSTKMTIVRNGGEWGFEDYPDLPLHEGKLALALDAWANIAAQIYVGAGKTAEEEAKDFGIRPETYTVTVTMENGIEQGFKLGRVDTSDQKAFAKRLQDNTIWKLDVQMLSFVKASRAELQDKRISHGFAADVTTIDYIDLKDDVSYTVQKHKDVWRFRTPGQVSAIIGAPQVADILYAVEEMEWDSFTAASDELKARVRLEFKDDAGNLLYWFEELASTADSISLRTPAGVFDVPRNDYQLVVDKWIEMMKSRQIETIFSSPKPDV